MDYSLEMPRETRHRPPRFRIGDERLAAGRAARRAAAWIALAMAPAFAAEASDRVLRAISPGTEQGAVIGDKCPVFSWAALKGASSYDLVVYEIGELVVGARPTLATRIPGGALSFTPPLDRCFERGAPYAWSVRAVTGDGASDWAAPLFFAVADEPPVDLAAALELVRRYLAAGDGERALASAPGEKRDSPRVPERSSEIDTSATPTPDAAHGPIVRQMSPGSVGANAAKVKVTGEVRTIDAGGELRLWGRGRQDIGIYPKPISPGTHYCYNPETDVTFGLSTAMVDWGSAADACPAGTWVCGRRDVNACDTARPDEEPDLIECDGTKVDLTLSSDNGWVNEATLTSALNFDHVGVLWVGGGGHIAYRYVCESLPVWCCWK
jgi:hypothetical protein